MVVNESLEQLTGQKKQTEDVTLHSGKLWWAFLQILIDRIISDEKRSLVAAFNLQYGFYCRLYKHMAVVLSMWHHPRFS